MNNIVITDINLAARLFQSGILKFFSSEELNFHITDFCYMKKNSSFSNDKMSAKTMIDQGLLKIVETDEIQMQRVELLYNRYKPKFILQTISALVFADNQKYKLISEDELLREVASHDFRISSYSKEWLITDLVHEISMMGVSIDIEIIRNNI